MKFTLSQYVPSLDLDVKFNQINNNHYFEILKFITNKNDEGLAEYFDWLVQELVTDKTITSNFTNLDKFLILLNLRSYSIGNKLSMNNNNMKYDILLSNVIVNILDKIKDVELTKFVISDKISINLSLPKKFILNNIDDIYKEMIDFIDIDEEKIYFSSLTDSEKDIILLNIPAQITGELLQFSLSLKEKFSNFKIIAGNEKMGVSPIPFSLLDSTLFYFLKSIYTDDLLNFYELQYNMINKIFISNEHFMQMTSNECKIFINFYNKDLKAQENEQKSSSQSIPSIPKLPNFK